MLQMLPMFRTLRRPPCATVLLLAATFAALAAPSLFAAAGGRSIHDPTAYPLVWPQPGLEQVAERHDVEYGRPADRALRLDAFTPAAPPPAGGRPVVLFVSGFGDDPERPLKNWGIYQSWLRTMAARGYVALMGETDRADVAGSLAAQLAWLRAHAGDLGVDTGRIGLWACSGNVPAALELAMSSTAGEELRMAALLYGAGEVARIRADLPVLLVIAGRDAPGLIEAERRLATGAVEAAAPWTVVEAPTLSHAFDAFDRSAASLATVRQVLSYFDAQLMPPPTLPSENASERDAREAIGHLYAREWQAAHDYYNDLADGAGAKDPRVWRNLAWARRGLGSKIGEVVALEQAVALEPEDLGQRRRFTRLAGAIGAWTQVESGLAPIATDEVADADDLGLLGLARLKLDRPEDAVAPLERSVALGGEPAIRYNLACALARTGRSAEAFTALAGAIEAGFADRKSLESDPDLEPLRADPRFRALVDRVEPAAEGGAP